MEALDSCRIASSKMKVFAARFDGAKFRQLRWHFAGYARNLLHDFGLTILVLQNFRCISWLLSSQRNWEIVLDVISAASEKVGSDAGELETKHCWVLHHEDGIGG
jgi:hypothetical protein